MWYTYIYAGKAFTHKNNNKSNLKIKEHIKWRLELQVGANHEKTIKREFQPKEKTRGTKKKNNTRGTEVASEPEPQGVLRLGPHPQAHVLKTLKGDCFNLLMGFKLNGLEKAGH